APDAAIDLRGLSPRMETRTLRLPGLFPTLVVDRPEDRADRLAMPLDTLWIDTAEERMVLVFRGDIAVSSTAAPDVRRLLVVLGRREVDRAELLPVLPRVLPCFAVEPPVTTR